MDCYSDLFCETDTDFFDDESFDSYVYESDNTPDWPAIIPDSSEPIYEDFFAL